MTSPRSSILGSFALLCGAFVCAAIGGAMTLMFGSGEKPVTPEQRVDATSELEVFAERLDLLEQRLAVPRASAEPTAHNREPAVDPVAMHALATRLDRLERTVAELQNQRRAAGPDDGRLAELRAQRTEETEADRQRRIQNHQNTILDPSTTEAQKLEAWSGLRHHEDSWNDAVVAQMVHLGLTSADPKVRADVWRQADARSQHEALVPALLQALRADADANAREEAAETIVEYADRPAVIASLDQLLATEQNEGVRRYLARAKEASSRPR